MITHSNKPNKPCVAEVEKYIQRWTDDAIYSTSENSLTDLFKKYPSNNNLSEVIVKVCTLDVIFSANVSRWFYEVSKHIVKYDFDTKFSSSQFDVNDFAKVVVNDKKTRKLKTRNFYSFATKYCNHHNPLDYPIYDSYLDEVLWHFRTEYNFLDFSREQLKQYSEFKATLEKFRTSFELERFNLREIDKYLWLLGKEFFG